MKSNVYQKALEYVLCWFCLFIPYEIAGRQLKRLIILISFVFLCKFRTSSSEDFILEIDN